MEKLRNHAEMAAKVALCPLWHTFTALDALLADCLEGSMDRTYPSDQDILRQRRVRVLDLDERELDAAI
jgi:hypothetical protein